MCGFWRLGSIPVCTQYFSLAAADWPLACAAVSPSAGVSSSFYGAGPPIASTLRWLGLRRAD